MNFMSMIKPITGLTLLATPQVAADEVVFNLTAETAPDGLTIEGYLGEFSSESSWSDHISFTLRGDINDVQHVGDGGRVLAGLTGTVELGNLGVFDLTSPYMEVEVTPTGTAGQTLISFHDHGRRPFMSFMLASEDADWDFNSNFFIAPHIGFVHEIGVESDEAPHIYTTDGEILESFAALPGGHDATRWLTATIIPSPPALALLAASQIVWASRRRRQARPITLTHAGRS